MNRLSVFRGLRDFGLTETAANKLISKRKHVASFGVLTLEGHMLTVNRKATGEVVVYDLLEDS